MVELPKQKYKYSLSLLDLARQIYEIQGTYPINPYNIHDGNLMNANPEWMQDFNRYMKSLEHYRHKSKPTGNKPNRTRRR